MRPRRVLTTAASFAEGASAPPFGLSPLPGVQLLKGAFALVYGEPGAGKSTLALQLLNAIGGTVLAYLPEEGDSHAVRARFARLGIGRPDLHVLARGDLQDLGEAADQLRPRAVLIDSLSVTSLEPNETRQLIERHGLRALFGVLQVNKKGEMAGLRAWEHEADLGVRVHDSRWSLDKSRFQPRPFPEGEVCFADADTETESP